MASASRQHDAADFLLHLHQVIHAPCLRGLWQSYDRNGTLKDEGGVCPLILSGLQDASEALPQSAQCHVNRWHSQRYLHALVPGSDAVVLQLNRFDFSNGMGVAQKLDHSIRADPDLLLPQWSSDSSQGILWKTYQLRAIIQHIGPSSVSGHYRAALQPLADDDASQWHYTDDATEATRVLPTSLESSNYLLFYQSRSAASSRSSS